jgi:hypothetical protein
VHGHAQFFEHLQHADVRQPARAPAREGEADARCVRLRLGARQRMHGEERRQARCREDARTVVLHRIRSICARRMLMWRREGCMT